MPDVGGEEPIHEPMDADGGVNDDGGFGDQQLDDDGNGDGGARIGMVRESQAHLSGTHA